MTTSKVNKPHLRLQRWDADAWWVCESKNMDAVGRTPKEAWVKWQANCSLRPIFRQSFQQTSNQSALGRFFHD